MKKEKSNKFCKYALSNSMLLKINKALLSKSCYYSFENSCFFHNDSCIKEFRELSPHSLDIIVEGKKYNSLLKIAHSHIAIIHTICNLLAVTKEPEVFPIINKIGVSYFYGKTGLTLSSLTGSIQDPQRFVSSIHA